jgi:hypothetical protein
MHESIRGMGRLRALLLTWLAVFLLHGSPLLADTGVTPSASTLHASYERLRPKLERNIYRRPLYLESKEKSNQLQGDIYALVAQPFALVNGALNDPAGKPTHWCDVLMLHLNIKYCRTGQDAKGSTLLLHIGRKMEQPLEDTHPVEFRYRVLASHKDYFAISLSAPKGPFNTHDYRILLEAIPAEKQRSFIHLTYSYGFGMAAKLAMKGYLSTTGRHKVGFTQVGTDPAGKPEYIKGVRGVVERNAMRYYVAIDSFLNALPLPRDQQFEKRLHDCIDTLDKYALQLHEVERDVYIKMKRNERRRQLESDGQFAGSS